VVAADVVCATGADPVLRLRQTGEDEDLWRIPVCVRHSESDGAGERCVLLAGREGEFPLGAGRCPEWIYPNHGERGYYRVALAPAGLAALTRNLGRLAPAEREGLVGNLWALVESGDLSAPALLEALDRFRRPDTGTAVLDVLERVSRTLVTPGSRPAFRAWAQDLVRAIAGSARESPDTAASAATRPLARDLERTLGLVAADPATIRRAGEVTRAFLANPRKADLETAPELLAIASAGAGPERFEAFARVARDGGPAERVAAVRGLGGFDDPALLGRAFDLALAGEVRAQDFRYLLVSARSDAARVAVVLGWVDQHLEALKERLPGQAAAALLGVAGELCEAAAIDRAEATFAARAKSIEGGERALTTALDRARRCAAIRAREGAAAAAWLAARGRPKRPAPDAP
jgi:alanyl aminopeptidase